MSLTSNILSSVYRVCVPGVLGQRNIVTATTPLYFRLTQVVGGEPLKKKKRLDPQIIRQREERKKRKIEKQIRRLEKNAGQLKPIDELEVPRAILKEIDIRRKPVVTISGEEMDKRAALNKAWSAYKYQQHRAEVTMIDQAATARERALEELREESEELWLEAVQIDPTLIPFKAKGPVLTPPIPEYKSPDGEYINITRIWE
ncbi:hypothetical protein Pcinc_023894 [Petrolisthes cinctipes]|uniref:Large ribosomal subunit protein mL40 n=1 Tax=Petrolisthes cinctipes TaxID=88211 RepID=A0AAE1KF66_PETCI|nr:hypothetical protein Pcinc_025570 [Petrolisthes cinctipes]KAK3870923.1 hypothetical protein Pcinc_023894 [Petrolisthes cinctipes]